MPSVVVNFSKSSLYLAQNLKVASTGFNHVIFLRILCNYVLLLSIELHRQRGMLHVMFQFQLYVLDLSFFVLLSGKQFIFKIQ